MRPSSAVSQPRLLQAVQVTVASLPGTEAREGVREEDRETEELVDISCPDSSSVQSASLDSVPAFEGSVPGATTGAAPGQQSRQVKVGRGWPRAVQRREGGEEGCVTRDAGMRTETRGLALN